MNQQNYIEQGNRQLLMNQVIVEVGAECYIAPPILVNWVYARFNLTLMGDTFMLGGIILLGIYLIFPGDAEMNEYNMEYDRYDRKIDIE